MYPIFISQKNKQQIKERSSYMILPFSFFICSNDSGPRTIKRKRNGEEEEKSREDVDHKHKKSEKHQRMVEGKKRDKTTISRRNLRKNSQCRWRPKQQGARFSRADVSLLDQVRVVSLLCYFRATCLIAGFCQSNDSAGFATNDRSLIPQIVFCLAEEAQLRSKPSALL